jgi:hypothetical protein
VNKHIGKNFNTTIADSLSPGKKRVFVQFKIDTKGNVKNIKARAPSKALEVEAERVLSTLPQFVPGKQKGKLVTVPYSIPIVFQVADRKTSEGSTTKIIKETYNTKRKKTDVISFSEIEIAPLFNKCDTNLNNEVRRLCTVESVKMFVNSNFNHNLAHELNLEAGQKRIFTSFTIDKQGNIKNIIARGPHPILEEEAIRVLKLLPQFTPGKQNDKVVKVQFSLPITLQIADSKKD